MLSSMRKRLGSKVKTENRLSTTSNGSTGPPVSPIFPSAPPPTPSEGLQGPAVTKLCKVVNNKQLGLQAGHQSAFD